MPLDKMTGEQAKLRFKVLDSKPAKPYSRPADFDTTAKELPELTTSTITAQVATNNDTTPKMYGSPKAGTGLTWAEPAPGEASWSGSMSGLVQPTEQERAAMLELQNALGRYVWLEQSLDGETKPDGGLVIITSRGRPVPVDGNVTFDIGFTGVGPNFLDTTAIV
ncbi:hypothetical protein ACFP81_06390 [Deinococcus lacus]|uniref:Uncharacterized protein n=1 Tax=Deinococcus lacus TaxID=392561 RepID=A0ABW1YBV7_9DEIO